jgi:hypothetical protein
MSPFKFLGFKGFAKKPKSNLHDDGKPKGKLRKIKQLANTTIGSVPPSRSERKESGEHYQNQVRTSASSVLNWIMDKENS